MSVDLARVRSCDFPHILLMLNPLSQLGALTYTVVKTLYNQNEIKYMYFVAYTWRASILVI